RKFYPPGSAEPSYDATPALETAYRWVTGLRRRAFVGTASRLATVVDLLKQVAIGTQEDPDERVAQLERERAAIDAQIAAIRGGDVPVLDRTAQLERYEQARETALELLSDFRQVEANFRALDLDLRERVALW
ncbi:DUF3375 domain-containing protein, partial [Escherichia coli]|uniref:DUF3375 domain-containing protein n=1 Tax=Escherichia coli TaxID=562 RepID=UPI0021589F9F